MWQGIQRTSKLFTIDRFAASAVAFCEVTTLKHKLGNNAVESGSLVAKAMLSRS